MMTSRVLTPALILLSYLSLALLLTHPLAFDLEGMLNLASLHPSKISWSDTPRLVFVLDHTNELLTKGESVLHYTRVYHPQGLYPAWDPFHPSYSFTGGMLSFFMKPVVAHNTLFLTTLMLSALTAFLLARHLLKDTSAAFLAGLIYTTFPFLLYQGVIGHANIMQGQWIPFIFLYASRSLSQPNPKLGFLTGLFIGLQFLSSTQQTAYLFLLGLLYLIVSVAVESRGKKQKDFQFMPASKISLLGFLVSAGWYVIHLFSSKLFGTRSIDINLSPIFILDSINDLINPESKLAFGAVPLILTLIGCYFFIKKRPWSLSPILAVSFTAFLFSLGPFHPLAPYTIFYHLWIPLQMFRVPDRIIIYSLLGVSILAAYGWRQITPQTSKSNLLSLGAFIALIWITSISTSPILSGHEVLHPESSPEQEINRFLAEEKEDFSVVEYPNTFNCMTAYDTIFHKKKVVGGCASFFPPEYATFLDTCGGSFLLNLSNNKCQEKVRQYNLAYVIYDSNKFQDWEAYKERNLDDNPHLTLRKNTQRHYLYQINL